MKVLPAFLLLAAFALLIAFCGCSDSSNGGSSPLSDLTGMIYTTDSTGAADISLFSVKGDIYLNGGPVTADAAGLPDGTYYARVTTVDGTILGKAEVPIITVSDGRFTAPYRLLDILNETDADGNCTDDGNGNHVPGFVPSTDKQYIILISMDVTFPPANCWSAKFNVDDSNPPPQPASLSVTKFYDANANGLPDGNQEIQGWKVTITDEASNTRYTPVSLTLAPDTYTVSESQPNEANWVATTPTSVTVPLAAGDAKSVAFGNVCLGAGNARGLAFWASRENKELIGADDLALLAGLHLRTPSGNNYDPECSGDLHDWLLQANALHTNHLLSAYLAVMELNVLNGFVNGDALIHAPGAQSANAAGFATVNALLVEVNAELGLHGTANEGDSWYAYQLALIDVLDRANNNLTFVQPTPGPFTF